MRNGIEGAGAGVRQPGLLCTRARRQSGGGGWSESRLPAGRAQHVTGLQ